VPCAIDCTQIHSLRSIPKTVTPPYSTLSLLCLELCRDSVNCDGVPRRGARARAAARRAQTQTKAQTKARVHHVSDKRTDGAATASRNGDGPCVGRARGRENRRRSAAASRPLFVQRGPLLSSSGRRARNLSSTRRAVASLQRTPPIWSASWATSGHHGALGHTCLWQAGPPSLVARTLRGRSSRGRP
jgi:hypothetical protein